MEEEEVVLDVVLLEVEEVLVVLEVGEEVVLEVEVGQMMVRVSG